MTKNKSIETKDYNSEIRWTFYFVLVLLLASVIHVYLALIIPLAEDETYYWEWSKRLAWGYYDQGPGIAWAIRASCFFFGDNEFGIRFPTLLSSFLTQCTIFSIGKKLFDNKVGFFSTFPFALTPIALAGGFLATYDSVLLLCWSLALLFCINAIYFDSRWSWLGVGIFFGIGLNFKYLMVLFPLVLLVFAIANKNERKLLTNPLPYLAFLGGSLMLIPNLIWLKNHDWITLSHVGNLTSKAVNKGFLTRLGDFLGSQAAIVGPVCFIITLLGIVMLFKRARLNNGRLANFVVFFTIAQFIFFLASLIRGEVIANWPAPLWITGAIACGYYLSELATNKKGRIWLGFVITLNCFIAFLLVFPNLVTKVGIHVPKAVLFQMSKMQGGTDLASFIEKEIKEMESRSALPVYVVGTHYGISSRLSYYMKKDVGCLFLNSRLNQYMYWNYSLLPASGENMIVVTSQSNDSKKRIPLELIFDRVEPQIELKIYWREIYQTPVRSYFVFKCFGYRPRPELMTRPGMKIGY